MSKKTNAFTNVVSLWCEGAISTSIGQLLSKRLDFVRYENITEGLVEKDILDRVETVICKELLNTHNIESLITHAYNDLKEVCGTTECFEEQKEMATQELFDIVGKEANQELELAVIVKRIYIYKSDLYADLIEDIHFSLQRLTENDVRLKGVDLEDVSPTASATYEISQKMQSSTPEEFALETEKSGVRNFSLWKSERLIQVKANCVSLYYNF